MEGNSCIVTWPYSSSLSLNWTGELLLTLLKDVTLQILPFFQTEVSKEECGLCSTAACNCFCSLQSATSLGPTSGSSTTAHEFGREELLLLSCRREGKLSPINFAHKLIFFLEGAKSRRFQHYFSVWLLVSPSLLLIGVCLGYCLFSSASARSETADASTAMETTEEFVDVNADSPAVLGVQECVTVQSRIGHPTATRTSFASPMLVCPRASVISDPDTFALLFAPADSWEDLYSYSATEAGAALQDPWQSENGKEEEYIEMQ